MFRLSSAARLLCLDTTKDVLYLFHDNFYSGILNSKLWSFSLCTSILLFILYQISLMSLFPKISRKTSKSYKIKHLTQQNQQLAPKSFQWLILAKNIQKDISSGFVSFEITYITVNKAYFKLLKYVEIKGFLQGWYTYIYLIFLECSTPNIDQRCLQ